MKNYDKVKEALFLAQNLPNFATREIPCNIAILQYIYISLKNSLIININKVRKIYYYKLSKEYSIYTS